MEERKHSSIADRKRTSTSIPINKYVITKNIPQREKKSFISYKYKKNVDRNIFPQIMRDIRTDKDTILPVKSLKHNTKKLKSKI